MANLLINRVNYSLAQLPFDLVCSKQEIFPFRLQLKIFKKKISSEDFEAWTKQQDIGEDDFVFFGFFGQAAADCFTFSKISFLAEKAPVNYFRRKFIREILMQFFKGKNFLVCPHPTGLDLSVFEKTGDFNADWSIYRQFDFIIKDGRDEISFNLASEYTLISNATKAIREHTRIVDTKDGFIKPSKYGAQGNQYRLIANRELKQELNVPHEIKKFNYKLRFKELMSFYSTWLLAIQNEYLTVEAGGLKNVFLKDLFKVEMKDNQMVFGKGQTDINPISGMRDYGPYQASPKAAENKFIFIFENRDDANKLYLHFKNGLKHFPGLWSYVGVPPTLNLDIRLHYSNIQNLKNEFDTFLQEKLTQDNYTNLFAIIIGPFNRQDSDEIESDLYYYLKGRLLEKGIASQFINHKGIREGSFHYYLPNIAVAILAKLGGIPWKLKNKKYDELVIGFNQKRLGDNKFIGSAVFFNNEGNLGGVVGYPESQSETILIQHLKNSIERFIEHTNEPPQRLVIHYYKPQSDKEQRSIQDLIQNELRLNIPFAIVEINDSKTQTDICFDQEFDMGMPESGVYIRTGYNEYLLFNNTRYQRTPLRTVLDELPIKVHIHFADTGGFSHRDLISQVYEFSRLYWKGLKQRSQPATTIYSKLIADFEAHFEKALPNNSITHEIPWFL